MNELAWIPPLNASLNFTSLVCLLAGRRLIARGREQGHRRAMSAACLASLFFLCFYLYYHSHVGHTSFVHQGWIRPVYFVILVSHILLATLIPIFAVLLLRWGLKGEREKHKRLARWAWPIWVYVSVTGLLVYFILYQWFPNPS